MNKKILSKILALSIITTTCMANTALASGEELHENFDVNKNIETRLALNDVIRSYSSYQGKSVVVEEVRRQSNGNTNYYRGTVSYIGKNGLFGDYQYLGDLNYFTLYKIVTPGGSIITPTSENASIN